MRIAFDHQIFAIQRYGGISRYFVELASRLAELDGVAVDVVVPIHVNAYVGRLGAARLIGREGPPVGRLSAPPRSWLNAALAGGWLATHNYDVVHQTYFAGGRPLRQPRTAVVVTVHDMIHERFPQYFPPWDWTAKRKRRAVEGADAVIAVSAATRDDLLKFVDVDPAKVRVVHHGCDLGYGPPRAGGPPSRSRPEASGDGPASEPYILYVGARGAYKNFATALTAWASTPRLHTAFRLVCFGSADFIARERAVVERYGAAQDRLQWVSGGDDLLATLYTQAAAFVYPSLWEGFGMPLLEAMSLGCPVVCSRVPATIEVAAGAAELFDPRAPADVAAALERVVFSPERSRELRTLGYARAAEFSWERCARETLAVYDEAVRRRMANLRA